MKINKGKSKEVYIEHIAKTLPIDNWFTKLEFSLLTGISLASSYQRLKTLVNVDGYLERKNLDVQKIQYKMSMSSRQKMIARGKENAKHRGKKILTSDAEIEIDIAKTVFLLKKEKAEKYLHSIKFI